MLRLAGLAARYRVREWSGRGDADPDRYRDRSRGRVLRPGLGRGIHDVVAWPGPSCSLL